MLARKNNAESKQNRVLNAWGIVYSKTADDLPKFYLVDQKGTFSISSKRRGSYELESSNYVNARNKITRSQLFKIKKVSEGDEKKNPIIVIEPKLQRKILVDGRIIERQTVITRGKCRIVVQEPKLNLVFEALCDVSRNKLLQNIGDSIRIIAELGTGGFGIVYKGLVVKNEQFCAVKTARYKTHKHLKTEFNIVKDLDHKFIIKFLGYREKVADNFLVYELADGGSLHHYIDKLNETECMLAFRQVKFFHRNQVYSELVCIGHF